jgi:hypothetical protein
MHLVSTAIDRSGLFHHMILVLSSFPIIDNLVAQRIRKTTQPVAAPLTYFHPGITLPHWFCEPILRLSRLVLGCGFCERRYGRKTA